jgi:superoxide reductase
MAKIAEIYKCMLCGNVIEVFAGGDGELVCCGEPMKRMIENTVDAAKEKHVPVIEKIDGGYKVKVGSVAHPMTAEHYIQFIEFVCDCCTCIKTLKPGDAPEAEFECSCAPGDVYAREHCNLHGLWKGKI